MKPNLLCLLLAAWALAAGAAEGSPTEDRLHSGMCDASAGAFLSEELFVVANDEDNTLRIYRGDRPGRPVSEVGLSSFLHADQEHPETDIEGAAWLGNRLYWITSHGNNKDGKFRASRHRFFATYVVRTSQGPQLAPVLRPYDHLLRDLVKERSLQPFGLAAASELAPKDEGGFNIEALCPSPEGNLLIGFRNPIPHGRALVMPFLNPEGVLRGQAARFGDPILLDMDGYGVRDMAWTGQDYLIVAGSYDSEGTSRLYRWDGKTSAPKPFPEISFLHFNPEAVLVAPAVPNRALVLSDDGTLQVDGEDCKTVADPNLRRFRSRWITLPEAL
jgi:hypothetical protein